MGDIQVTGEYVVHAIRTVHQLSGRQTDVLGFSQGGMLPRWALRFWPDTRPMVNAFVALDPSNHGTLDSWTVCHVLWSRCATSPTYAAHGICATGFV